MFTVTGVVRTRLFMGFAVMLPIRSKYIRRNAEKVNFIFIVKKPKRHVHVDLENTPFTPMTRSVTWLPQTNPVYGGCNGALKGFRIPFSNSLSASVCIPGDLKYRSPN